MSHSDIDIEDLPEDYEFHEGEEEGESIREEQPIVYNTEDFISTSFVSKNGTLPENILEFHHSYGYDCKRYYNLILPDEETAIFASGNLINFLNLNTNEIWFRRSYLGGGIGHITKNPNPEYKHIAIAENGDNPPIIIYEWPSLDIKHLLKGGTSAIYWHLNYSPDGMLLVSQGGEPDHLITVWDWPQSKILLRTKSYVSDVHRVKFSPYVPGHLSSCGLSHIKFWKMAHSFTGLKLQGELGRFGKTEYTDILGIYGMPDEKVISGCFWGNILIWEAGLIKVEVFRQLRKKCHDGPIVQFDYKNGELWTVAMDGRIRVWSYDVIDQADPPDDDRIVQIEPVYDFYTPNVQFMCICKLNEDNADTFYIAQDGNGGIWKIDLPTLTLEIRPSVQLFKCHAGKIMDIATCPWMTYLASLGEDGRLYMYNYVTLELIFQHQFPAKGRAMIWLPLHVTNSGNQIVMAFDDGNLRVVILDMVKGSPTIKMHLIQVIKPHNKPITCMSINKKGSVIVTGGEDATIFILQIFSQRKAYPNLVPIGYIHVPGIVTYLGWHHKVPNNLLVGCIHGHIVQVQVPIVPQAYTDITYILDLDKRMDQRFTTYKSQIKRNIKIAEIEAKKAEKRERKRVAMEQMLKDNPGLEVDEEIYLADSDSEEELEPLHIPDIPNKVLWLQSTEENTIWLSMGGYDAGYIYEYNMKQKEDIPSKCTIICDGDDVEINSFVYNYNKKYMILALQYGQIKVVKVNPDDFRDFSNYWQISMHDNVNGFIPRMCFSHDEKIFFSCGYDGNIFSYIFNPENADYITPIKIIEPQPENYVTVEDVNDYSTLSLEEEIVKKELDRQERVANANKNAVLNQLAELKESFERLLVRNSKMLPTQIIPREDLEIDSRITEDLQKMIDAEMELEKRKLAYQVEKSEIAMKKLMRYFTDPLDVFPLAITGIEKKVAVRTTRQKLLTPAFYKNLAIIEEKILEQELKGRPPEREKIVIEAPPPPEKKEKPVEYFLLGLSPSTIQKKLGIKLTRTLAKYRAWKAKVERRQQEWEKFKAFKPLEGINQPDDIAALHYALETIGDYKLKSASDYKVPPHLRENKVKKYKELLLIREKVFEERYHFNIKVYYLRRKKVKLIKEYKKLYAELMQVQKEMSAEQIIEGPSIPEISDDHFPEKNVELRIEMPLKYQEPSPPEPPFITSTPSKDLLEKEVLPYVDVDLYEETLETPWEIEARSMRMERKLFQQNELIKKMKNLIQTYDQDVANLKAERYEMLIRATFLDIHILDLNQELSVLTKFESHEDKLSNAVNTNMLECMTFQDVLININSKIETHKAAIDILLEKEKEVQTQFYSSIADNKFYDFLKRIFKKKYKPPKEHDPDESDSESSSSSSSEESEEEDAASVDSRDFGIIKLDDSVCPKGCDKRLYDLSFTLRSQRHALELETKDQRNNIELLKKEEESKMKQIRILEANLQESQDELEAFQREKQQKLNEVDKTIITRLHQFQCVTEDYRKPNIWDTLLFNKTTLTRLYKRVGQLQLETLQQKAKHKVNITHLQRMTTDCKYMMKTIDSLRDDIKELLIQKFGSIVDIDDVEEAYLKKLVYDLRMSQTDIKSLYLEEMQYWRNNFEETQIKLADIIKQNTTKLDLLVVLIRERSEFQHGINMQQRKKLHIGNVIDIAQECRGDIQKLSNIVKSQKQHLQDLKDEIKTLKTKGVPIKSDIEKRLFEPLQPEVEEADSLDWIGYDEYVKTEYAGYETETEERQFKEVIKLPSVISEKAEDMAAAIIMEMLDSLERPDIFSENMVKNLIKTAMNRSSVTEVIDDLMLMIPFEINDTQTSIIETSAEKLYSLQEPEVTEKDLEICTCESIAQIMEEILILYEAPCDIVVKMLLGLIEQIPLTYLLKKTSIDCIVEKLNSVLPCVDTEQLTEAITALHSPYIKDIKKLLDSILTEVFGSGLDYLYILPDKSLV